MPLEEKVGNYQIVSPIAKGGMGRVFLARHERTGEYIAIKVLPDEFLRDRKRSHYLHREMKLAKELDHPNVINIYGIYLRNNVGYLMMEFMDGGNLRQHIRSKNPTLYDALNLILQTCEGIHYIHHHRCKDGRFHSIIHRDIKPENILLSSGGRLKVADFGLSVADEGWRLLGPKSRAGTPYYISPEQIRSKSLDIRSDIYSLGVVIYELLAGQLPYKAKGTEQYMRMVISRKLKPIPPSHCNRNVPPQLDAVTLRALENSPVDRYQTVAEMILDLKRLPPVLRQLSF